MMKYINNNIYNNYIYERKINTRLLAGFFWPGTFRYTLFKCFF